ncbi:MAG TPA: hypothetical protein PLI34_17220, partial [Saprospiraceae bacterium]|nr:hypothetical protein [Saprospiraceae bacterium]
GAILYIFTTFAELTKKGNCLDGITSEMTSSMPVAWKMSSRGYEGKISPCFHATPSRLAKARLLDVT